MVPVKGLKPAKYNPREISELAFLGLKASLQRFGMPQPVVANKKNKVVVGGHMRLRAAKELGWDKVPVIWVSLSETEERALNVTLNNPAISGYFTDDLQTMLEQLRGELPETDFAALALHQLESKDGWQSGQSRLDSTEANLDGIESIIKVRCPQEAKAQVTQRLAAFISELGIRGVSVG